MANSEHLELVRRGVAALNEFARENHDVAVDLEGADLRGMNLAEASLINARLAGANLEGADLRKARLPSADLSGANLREADLRGASLHRANLIGADLRGARFDTFGVGGQQMCLAPAFFEGVHWDRETLDAVLSIVNLNPDWEVRYEILPRTPS